MAVTLVPTSTRSIADLWNYCTAGTAHNGDGDRFEHLTTIKSFVPSFVVEAMAERAKWGKDDPNSVQAYHEIVSYLREEFDASKPEEVRAAHEMSVRIAEKTWPGRQVAVVTQIDGVSGLVHSHIIIASVSYRDGRSIRSEDKNINRLRAITDEEVLATFGHDNQAKMTVPAVRTSVRSMERQKKGVYDWESDLQSRLREIEDETIVEAGDLDSFIAKAAEHGIEVQTRGKERNLSYGFTDESGKSRRARGKSLGSDFMVTSLEQRLELRHRQHVSAQPQPEPVIEHEEPLTMLERMRLRSGMPIRVPPVAQPAPEPVDVAEEETEPVDVAEVAPEPAPVAAFDATTTLDPAPAPVLGEPDHQQTEDEEEPARPAHAPGFQGVTAPKVRKKRKPQPQHWMDDLKPTYRPKSTQKPQPQQEHQR